MQQKNWISLKSSTTWTLRWRSTLTCCSIVWSRLFTRNSKVCRIIPSRSSPFRRSTWPGSKKTYRTLAVNWLPMLCSISTTQVTRKVKTTTRFTQVKTIVKCGLFLKTKTHSWTTQLHHHLITIWGLIQIIAKDRLTYET